MRPKIYLASSTMAIATLAIATLATATLAAAGCSGLAAGQATIKVRQPAPEIAGVDQQNQPVSLRRLTARGRVLVVFYRGHF